MIYLDTSVLVAYYCPEPLSKRAELIIRGRRPVVISDLTQVEAVSALARKIRMGEIAAEDAAAARNHFVMHVDQGIYRLTSLGPHHIRSAREFLSSFTTPLRTLDALHLAIAASENLEIVTADETFARSARKFAIRTKYISAR